MRVRPSVGLLVLTAVTAAALAEDITVTTYYPSPRGVYNELRTSGDVGIGVTGSPVGARLHVIQTDATRRALQVESPGLPAPSLMVAPNGNVGIRTANPDVPLHVFGEIHASAFRAFETGGAYAFLERGVDNDGVVWLGGYSLSATFIPTLVDGAPLALQTRSGGNVGIGTAAPASKLNVSGGVAIGSGYTGSTAPSNGLIIQGELGVGTVNPGSRVGINGNAAIGSGYAGSSAPSNGLIVQGDVGVGTTTPTAKLDVAGEAKISGISADGAGKVVCIKGDGALGTCASTISGVGTCACD